MPITPNQGSTGGGTPVSITGSNLSGTTAVRFGTRLATDVVNVSPTEVTAVSPSGTGVVGVTVTTPGGTSNPVPFYYVGAGFKTALAPTSGSTAGGDTITLTGTGLSTASSVDFGGNSVTPTVVSDNEITAIAPAGTAGPVSITVTTAAGPNNGLTYTYYAVPDLTAVTPDAGPTTGGTTVTLSGTDLGSTSEVTFDGTPAPFTVLSDTAVSAVTPPGTAGPVDVAVTTAGGSDVLPDGFTYVAPPGV
ncbi:IPT/TIG domain-containing protein [Streptomyces sp. ACA25]|uniref:IPT/TIG domain-containing protein n=1 Tax=Streptomyces sp. ACA25 TaxID=3022596 RepID=UPI002307A63A|nr:IPT/TIG domain-containing protein [Streptomyces sp. ACA25]MDB1087873.1 IPT/TIG domain-containing protein [Streptomyces sp. ACA25]